MKGKGERPFEPAPGENVVGLFSFSSIIENTPRWEPQRIRLPAASNTFVGNTRNNRRPPARMREGVLGPHECARSQAPAWERGFEAPASRAAHQQELVARVKEAGASTAWVPKLEPGNQKLAPRLRGGDNLSGLPDNL